jgi:glutamine synthetase
MTHARSHARYQAVKTAGSRDIRKINRPVGADGVPLKTSEYYGSMTFSFDLMERKLQAKDVAFLRESATSKNPISRELADKVAQVVKEWAISKGATHYSHWFQPQTGATAEKHDSFFTFDANGGALEKFTGSMLIQAEPDASSFPSGGMRATFEARGYTAWDPSSPMFLMETENGTTLCIPSVFISYSGEALDKKTPLLRSINALSIKATESLKLLGFDGIKHVIATAGPEQEYFLIDESLFNLRSDLMLAGRTLLGKTPPRHQQLEDHYFGSIKARVLNFMMEVDHELYKLGVPIKTRHNEVAPAQYEAAPIFENANVAADHNQLAMEVIKNVARRHRLVALFHEKPYSGINGSGKHVNWSLADSDGNNLLEPGESPMTNIRFLYFLAATVKAIHDNGALIRSSIASAGNDHRLGANEAPPAIISVFLGETLSEVLDNIVDSSRGGLTERASTINLDLAKVPVISRDNTDRNRTSPFAFTGNKFEFRAVGASASISLPLTTVNTTVAQALEDMNAMVRAKAGGARPSEQQVLEVIQDVVKATKKVRFEGDNYSEEWHKEAEKRGLPHLRNTPEALRVFKDTQVHALLEKQGIMKAAEATSRYNVMLERYNKIRLIELECLNDMVANHVLPALFAHQGTLGQSIRAASDAGVKPTERQQTELKEIAALTDQVLETRGQLNAFLSKCGSTHNEEQVGTWLATEGMGLAEKLAVHCNEAEARVDDTLWSLPKYREMLYLI